MPVAPATDTPSIASLYATMWRHARGARGTLAAALALLGASQLVKLAVPWLAAQAINALQQGGTSAIGPAATWVALIMLAYLVTWGMHGPARVMERSVGVRVRRGVADALYMKLMRAPLAWHDQRHSGEVQHRMGQASGALFHFAQNQYIYLQNAINFVGPLVALVLLSVTTGAVALAGYALVAVIILRFDRALMRLAAQENAAERRYAAGTLDFLGNIATVLSLRLAARTRAMLNRRLDAVFAPLARSIVLNEAKWCAVDILSVALTWGLVVTYVWQVDRSGATLLMGSVFMIYQYAQQARGVITTMASSFQEFARTRTDYASADLIWQAPERPADPPAGIAPGWQSIDLRELSFTHRPATVADSGRRGGLQKVSLSLRRGERIALVGPSGSGKSTLLRLLAGLYEPEHGQIDIDQRPHAGLQHLGSIATLIPQEAEVFEASVTENIAFADACDPALLQEAMHVSVFDAVLQMLPQGLATPLTERGMNLSGGQRQRLCLARGVFASHGSSLLLLDEPTSALDPLTEALVHERLHARFPDACIVASVHRMSLLCHFDKVVLMAAGRVVDVGTPAQLSERQPVFAAMVQGAGHSVPEQAERSLATAVKTETV